MAAGFIGFEITWRADIYRDAPQASSAAGFGTLGITFRARKPRDARDEQEAQDALEATSGEQVCAVTPPE